MARIRARDLRRGRARGGPAALHHRRVPATRAAAGVVGARQRARGSAYASGVAGTGLAERRLAHAGGTRARPGGKRMRMLVTGAAGFIGSTFARLYGGEHELVVLDKLTYAGRRENLPSDVELVEGAIEDRELVFELVDDFDAIVNFAAESHVDRSIADQEAFARTHVIGTSVLLDAAREKQRRPLPAGLDRRGLRLDRVRLVHRDLAARPVLALLGHQGGRRPARLRARAHLRARGGDLPRLEQLRPAPVPREADPADGPQRAARRRAAGLRRRPAGAQLALRRGLLPRHLRGADARVARARPTTSAAPARPTNLDVVQRSSSRPTPTSR